jgi:uncharacterized protein YraI
MKYLGPLVLSTMVACGLPYAAQAQGQVAFTAKTVNVRAGPSRDYPIVAVLPAGYQVVVQGCLSNYTWCDVLAGPNRGWVYAGNISYAYQNTYVPVLNYGALIGIGVLAFILDDYWGHHYHDRPWYAERHRWIHRPAPAPRFRPSPPPPPPGVTGPRPHPPAPIGPRPAQPPARSVVPRSQPSNPSGGVLPGPSVPAPQATPRGQAQRRPAPGAGAGRQGGGRGPDQHRQ